MYHPTQPPQIFTVFGSYPIGPEGDYFPTKPNGQDCRSVTKIGPAEAIIHPAHEGQQIRY